MPDLAWYDQHAQRTLERLLPRLEPILELTDHAPIFVARLEKHFVDIFRLLHLLYGDQYDFFYQLEQILLSMAQLFVQRPLELSVLDTEREGNPLWFQSEQMVGGVCYVDLFAGDLSNLHTKIPYFQELGLTYLHLMPLFQSPEENSDGGYAVSNYREVNPTLGTMQQLAGLAAELRRHGISLVLDFVFNHTSDEHTWAKLALDGDVEHQDFYRMFDDRTVPDQYEQTLREIFPEQDPGNFTYIPEIRKWVWTTFYHFQWDLNYNNPAVFRAMMEEMLFLANQGVEVLRLDAVAFIWKQMGTSCENLPQAHWIIQAYNAIVKVVAPAMLFKSEAIVHPRDVNSYIDWNECQISYNPTLMALLWESLATREVRLLRHSMSRRFDIPAPCAWVNYVRVHDDIGWTFADEDAAELGINGYDHRQFLNQFYIGNFDGSFATGLPFNYNPINQDMRITGTGASLAGLEKALSQKTTTDIDYAIQRILLIHSVILSAGGIPLLYLGDEIATLNDYSYENDPAKREDTRWVHRPTFDWERAETRTDKSTPQGQVFQGLIRQIEVRKNTPTLSHHNTLFFDSGNSHVLAYIRNKQILCLANFSETEQIISTSILRAYVQFGQTVTDLLSRESVTIDEHLVLLPYAYVWLQI